jgi:divalent metal cation (Fe/Co/Zn/Cd) transporter
MDVRLPASEEAIVERAVLQYEGFVSGFHKLRSRRSGHQRYVDFHLLVNPDRSVREVHDICDQIERDILAGLPDTEVTIHVEPDVGRFREPRRYT